MQMLGEHSKIRVSQYFLSAPIEEIRATIMHELIHMVPEAGHGHGYDWKVIANAVNRAYPQYNIKRTGSQVAGSQRSFNLSQSAGKNTLIAQHLIKCECCGSEFRRNRESNLTLHPERYKCRCGGRLVRVF